MITKLLSFAKQLGNGLKTLNALSQDLDQPKYRVSMLDMKEQSVRVKKLPLAHKIFASNECVLQYLASLQLKMNQRKHPPLHEKDIK